MDKLDSAMRESQRHNMPSPIGVLRRVVAKDGVTTPSSIHLPKDSVLAVNAWAIHDDEKICGADTDQFKPFRLSEKRADERIDYVERARQTWATTSAESLAFGGGRSACPGRFFRTAEVKMMLYTLMSYDLEMQDKRPENFILGLNVLPPTKATIRIKRREKAPVF